MSDEFSQTLGEPIMEAQAIGRRFDEGSLHVTVLDDINLRVHAGDSLAIVGASGSGKSTLLHILGGLDTPTQGKVRLMGRTLAGMSAEAVGMWRNQHLGFVYQFHHLLAEFTAMENVAMPLWIRRMNKQHALQQATEALHAVGLKNRAAHRPAQLSGGERQRVAIARALVTCPACILADEPTGNLDRGTAKIVFDLMQNRARAQGSALVLVTHDHELASQCQSVMILERGRLLSQTTASKA